MLEPTPKRQFILFYVRGSMNWTRHYVSTDKELDTYLAESILSAE